MIKILLALTILVAGAAGFFTVRQSTTQILHEAKATREAWMAQTQLGSLAQSDQASLIEHVRELKQALTQPQAVGENVLWSAVQTNSAGYLTPGLRERLLEELGFNWKSSDEFIVVSKEALREIQMKTIRDGKLTDNASTVLAITPGERGQVEAAMERVQTDYKDWALSHIERTEPRDDVVAQYTLPGDPALNVSNNFATGVFAAVGRERAEMITASARNWMISTIGISQHPENPTTIIVKRYLSGNEQRLKVQKTTQLGITNSLDLWQGPQWGLAEFPAAFRPVFPNGWADVAKREGFEMPKESQEK